MTSTTTVVWARQKGYPWWPSLCFDSWDTAAPLFELPAHKPLKEGEKVVKYFNHSTWGTVSAAEEVLPFLENAAELVPKVRQYRKSILQAARMAFEYLRIPPPAELGIPDAAEGGEAAPGSAVVVKRRLEVQQTAGEGSGSGSGSGKRARTSSSSVSAAARPAGWVPKRDDYLTFPDFFMGVAQLAAMRSKDPSTQVGACIVSPENKIVGIGYNGFPIGCSDDVLPWARTADSDLDTKYMYVCHAEMNAIMNKNSAHLHDCTIYVMLFPCHECAKMIIQAGIRTVVFYSDKYHETSTMTASRRMFDMAGVVYRQHQPAHTQIILNF